MSSLRVLATDQDKPIITKTFLIDEIRKEYQKKESILSSLIER